MWMLKWKLPALSEWLILKWTSIKIRIFLNMLIWTKVSNFTEKNAFSKIFQPTLKCTFLSETELPIKNCSWCNSNSENFHFCSLNLVCNFLLPIKQYFWLHILSDLKSLNYLLCLQSCLKLICTSDVLNINRNRVNPPEILDSSSAVWKMLWGQFGNNGNGFHSMIWKVWWIFTYVKLCNFLKSSIFQKSIKTAYVLFCGVCEFN